MPGRQIPSIAGNVPSSPADDIAILERWLLGQTSTTPPYCTWTRNQPTLVTTNRSGIYHRFAPLPHTPPPPPPPPPPHPPPHPTSTQHLPFLRAVSTPPAGRGTFILFCALWFSERCCCGQVHGICKRASTHAFSGGRSLAGDGRDGRASSGTNQMHCGNHCLRGATTTTREKTGHLCHLV